MNITTSQELARVPVTVFHIQGEINATTYEELERQAKEAYNNGTRNLLLDLAQVRYVSSAGFRAIHSIFKLLRTDTLAESDEAMSKGLRDGTFKSPHLKLLNLQPSVLRAMSLAGFDMYLDIHNNLKDALASF
jgi:anti-anti-sigma factor